MTLKITKTRTKLGKLRRQRQADPSVQGQSDLRRVPEQPGLHREMLS